MKESFYIATAMIPPSYESFRDLCYYCVVDLEATCDDQALRAVPHEEMETIEIGAVMVAGTTLVSVDEFQAFVRPVRHPQLSAFCTKLTTITQQQVDQAGLFPDVFGEFLAWAAT